MFENKKSLLQKARIAMVAIVTILGLGASFAMSAPKHRDSITYGVTGTVGNQYKVVALTPTSGCDDTTNPACEVSSSAPETGGMIPKAGATIVLTGTYHN